MFVGKARNAKVLIGERRDAAGKARGRRRGPREEKRLMEMDLAMVEIRWGNCEKMAGVLARGGGGKVQCEEEKLRKVEF